MIKLTRHSQRPIFRPRPANPWEAASVFNAAAILDNNLVHLVYRATNISSGGQLQRKSARRRIVKVLKDSQEFTTAGILKQVNSFTVENQYVGVPGY